MRKCCTLRQSRAAGELDVDGVPSG
jgi:hypothetical protein